MMKAVKIAAKGVKLKEAEAVTVDGVEFLINYETKKIYKDEDELANLDDIPCALPPEAIKAMLVTRAKEKWEQEEEGANNLIDLFAGLM